MKRRVGLGAIADNPVNISRAMARHRAQKAGLPLARKQTDLIGYLGGGGSVWRHYLSGRILARSFKEVLYLIALAAGPTPDGYRITLRGHGARMSPVGFPICEGTGIRNGVFLLGGSIEALVDISCICSGNINVGIELGGRAASRCDPSC
jgi:hypothetical protein